MSVCVSACVCACARIALAHLAWRLLRCAFSSSELSTALSLSLSFSHALALFLSPSNHIHACGVILGRMCTEPAWRLACLVLRPIFRGRGTTLEDCCRAPVPCKGLIDDWPLRLAGCLRCKADPGKNFQVPPDLASPLLLKSDPATGSRF